MEAETIAMPKKRQPTVEYLPTLEEIATMCKEFQEGWSPAERERRWTGPRATAWEVPRGVAGE